MITAIKIENYKCFRDFKMDLGPFAVLIGPNDTGKTALLEAIVIATFGWRGLIPYSVFSVETGIPFDEHSVWAGAEPTDLKIRLALYGSEERERCELTVGSRHDRVLEPVIVQPGAFGPQPFDVRNPKTPRFVRWQIGKTALYRFEPNALREASPLKANLTASGKGFPTFLDDIHRTSPRDWAELQEEFRARFGHYTSFRIGKAEIRGHADYGFTLEFESRHGGMFPASAVSDGVMLSLAFMALTYAPQPMKILCVEEPENGVHHASLRDIIRTLKGLAMRKNSVQVILTTHSPYLLDQVEPEEVRVFAKDEEGAVHATRLSDYPDMEDMKKHFMTGEIWTSLDESEVVERSRGNK